MRVGPWQILSWLLAKKVDVDRRRHERAQHDAREEREQKGT